MDRIRPSAPGDAARLLGIWRGAVLATHRFLDPADLSEIERFVRDGYLPAAALRVAVDRHDRPLGFLGSTGANIDALFVDPAHHGRGIGRRLVEHAAAAHPVLTVDVNEQNAVGLAFWRRLGFAVIGRSPTDDAGRPYPILHLRRAADAIPGVGWLSS